jgi:hypothetical protein
VGRVSANERGVAGVSVTSLTMSGASPRLLSVNVRSSEAPSNTSPKSSEAGSNATCAVVGRPATATATAGVSAALLSKTRWPAEGAQGAARYRTSMVRDAPGARRNGDSVIEKPASGGASTKRRVTSSASSPSFETVTRSERDCCGGSAPKSRALGSTRIFARVLEGAAFGGAPGGPSASPPRTPVDSQPGKSERHNTSVIVRSKHTAASLREGLRCACFGSNASVVPRLTRE